MASLRTCITLPVLVLGLCWPLAAWSQSAMDQMRHFYNNVDTFEAFFVQELLDEDMQRMELVEGTVWLSRPDRFRWEYSAPYEQVIVGDGEKIRMFDVELAQITVRPMDETLASTPAMLLAGGLELEERFRTDDLGRLGGHRWVELTPEVRDTDFRVVRLGFGDEGLVAMELIDSFDQTTRIRFARVKVNEGIDDTRFALEVPEGVDVVGE